MNIGISQGYYAIKTRHFSFPVGITAYSHEPYVLQNILEYGEKFFVCGTGRQPILRNKIKNKNYYLLPSRTSPKNFNNGAPSQSVPSLSQPAFHWLDLAGRRSRSGGTFALLPSR